MRSSRTRSLSVTAAVLVLAVSGWYYLAPTQLGGSTRYMITHGISMEPMLHTGDLVVVRPASDYRVGQVVAYRSTLLHTVVLHRIHAIVNGHYTFKGDNNDFLDPTHPTRALLLGRMWLHIPHAGTVLDWVHKPWVAAALTGGVAIMLLFGGEQRRRRRNRRRSGRQPAARSPGPALGRRPVSGRQLSAVAAAIALLLAGVAIYAFTQPKLSTTTTTIPYTQQVSFGYSAHVRPSAVYPSGVVSTGDPLYGPLVHHLRVTAGYRLSSSTPYNLRGSVRLRATVANSTGWSRSFWLGPPAQITAGRAIATGHISFPQLGSLVNRVTTQIGPAAGSYELTIMPRLRLSGEVGGQPLSNVAQPSLRLDLSGSQLLSGSSASTPGSGATPGAGLVHTTNGSVTAARTTVDKLGPVPIKTVRLTAIAGFALCVLLAYLLGSRAGGVSPDPAARINARYRHLIVPVSEIHTNPDNPPIEVRTIEALARLAERSERLILHDHRADVDNYMIDDQGTLFRFQALRVHQSNRNGSGTGTGNGNGKPASQPEGPVTEAPVASAQDAAAAATAAQGPEAPSTKPAADVRSSAAAATTPVVDEPAPSTAGGHAFEPLSDPTESAEAIRISSKVTPAVQGPQARRPPVPNYTHWTRRPEVRVGVALGPLLTVLALRHMRARRLDNRPADTDERSSPPAERRRAVQVQAPPRVDRRPPQGESPQPPRDPGEPPQRGPGDRRRGERRNNE